MSADPEVMRRQIAEKILQADPFTPFSGTAVPGKWHKVAMPQQHCANGEEYCCYLKRGTSPNLIVYLIGGGFLWDEASALCPSTLESLCQGEPCLYTSSVVPDNDYWFFALRENNGILSDREDNPFRDWSIGMVNYGTGDFHLGRHELDVVDASGRARTIHCGGYENLHACLRLFQQQFDMPRQLLICGESAGGFAVPGAAQEILPYFPTAAEVTLLTDSALIEREDWRSIAQDVWRIPEYLSACIHTQDIVSDWYERFCKDAPIKACCLFACGVRDVVLAQYQAYIDSGVFSLTADAVSALKTKLIRQHERLSNMQKDFHFYYHDFSGGTGAGSQHCTLAQGSFTENAVDGITPAQWLWRCLGGQACDVGLRLLGVD